MQSENQHTVGQCDYRSSNIVMHGNAMLLSNEPREYISNTLLGYGHTIRTKQREERRERGGRRQRDEQESMRDICSVNNLLLPKKWGEDKQMEMKIMVK